MANLYIAHFVDGEQWCILLQYCFCFQINCSALSKIRKNYWVNYLVFWLDLRQTLLRSGHCILQRIFVTIFRYFIFIIFNFYISTNCFVKIRAIIGIDVPFQICKNKILNFPLSDLTYKFTYFFPKILWIVIEMDVRFQICKNF